MFQASLRPSSGGQTAFSMHMVICPVKEIRMKYCVMKGGFVLCNRCVCVYVFGVFIVGK